MRQLVNVQFKVVSYQPSFLPLQLSCRLSVDVVELKRCRIVLLGRVRVITVALHALSLRFSNLPGRVDIFDLSTWHNGYKLFQPMKMAGNLLKFTKDGSRSLNCLPEFDGSDLSDPLPIEKLNGEESSFLTCPSRHDSPSTTLTLTPSYQMQMPIKESRKIAEICLHVKSGRLPSGI